MKLAFYKLLRQFGLLDFHWMGETNKEDEE